MHRGGVAAGVGELVELVPGRGGELVQPRRELEVLQGLLHPAQAGVHEPVPVADLLAVAVQHVLELEGLGHVHRRLDPVVEQVAVADEHPAPVGHRLPGARSVCSSMLSQDATRWAEPSLLA